MIYKSLLDKMQAVSSNVDTYIKNEQYLPAIGLEPTESVVTIDDKKIVNNCIEILIDEFQSLGIVFECDMEELVGSFYHVNYLILLRKIFDLGEFKHMIKYNRNLYDKIDISLLDDIDTQRKVLLHLSYITEQNIIDNEYNETLSFFYDKLANTDIYINNIKTLIRTTTPISFVEFYDLNSGIALIEDVDRSIEVFKTLYTKALKVDNTLDTHFLTNAIGRYNTDKISPSELQKFNVWFQFKDSAEVAYMKDFVKSIEILHKERSDHHIEFYRKRPDIKLNKERYLLLLAGLHGTGDDESTKVQEIMRMMYDIHNELSQNQDIPDDVMEFIKKVMNV